MQSQFMQELNQLKKRIKSEEETKKSVMQINKKKDDEIKKLKTD